MSSCIHTPKPLNISKPAVHQFAESVADALHYTDYRSLEEVVGNLGGEIIEQDIFDLSSTDDGSIDVRALTDFTIYVQDFVSSARKRFTIAHELGHYFLHYQVVLKGEGQFRASRYTDGETDRAEWEANWFAAGFLMPRPEFLAAQSELNQSLTRVAERFGVSLAAARFHAKYYDIELR